MGKLEHSMENVSAVGTTIERGLALVRVRIDNEILPSLVIFGDEGSRPVLGRITMEELGLSVDGVSEELERPISPPQDDV